MHNGRLSCGEEQPNTERGEILAQTKILFSTATKAFFFLISEEEQNTLASKRYKEGPNNS